MNSHMIIILLAYTFLLLFLLIFCLIVDPATSPTAHFFSITLPERIWYHTRRVVGKRGVAVLEFITSRFLVVVYFAVVLGGWVLVFFYCYPWAREYSPDYLPSYHFNLGYIICFACFASWRLANVSSPGIITSRNVQQFDNYPYDRLLFLPNRICSTDGIIKVARSKFDSALYHANVARFDHFCGWVYNTIGEQNYRYFLLFLLVHVGMCIYGCALMVIVANAEIDSKHLMEVVYFDKATGAEYNATNYIVAQYMINRHITEAGLLILMFVMAITLSLFLAYHIYITSIGRTTNEDFKWSQVKKWHKKQNKKYQYAFKNGLVKKGGNRNENIDDTTTNSLKATTTTKSDVNTTNGSVATQLNKNDENEDINCAPPIIASSKVSNDCDDDDTDDETDLFEDPGPYPQNIYNRGFIQNWMEVLFPLSLRTDTSKVKKES